MQMSPAAQAFEQAKAKRLLARVPEMPEPRYVKARVELCFRTDYSGSLLDLFEASDRVFADAIDPGKLTQFGDLVLVNPVAEWYTTEEVCR